MDPQQPLFRFGGFVATPYSARARLPRDCRIKRREATLLLCQDEKASRKIRQHEPTNHTALFAATTCKESVIKASRG